MQFPSYTKLAVTVAVLTILTSLPQAVSADQVTADDLIVQGSLCVGIDCVVNENFGFDTIRMRENNLRIGFDDTSSGAFPSNDWQIEVNSSASGGSNHFAIVDVTAGETVFRVCAVADTSCTPIGLAATVDPQTAINTTDIATHTTQIGALTTSQAAQDTAISGVQTTQTTQTGQISSLQTTTGTHTTQIGTLQTTAATQGTQITTLQSAVAGHGTRLGTLETVSNQHSGAIVDLQSASTAHDGRISSLETTSDDHEDRLGALEGNAAQFSGDISALKSGVAVAIAMGGGVALQSDQNGAIAINYANFAGQGAMGLAGAVRLDTNLALNFGVGSGMRKDTTGARVGLQYSW